MSLIKGITVKLYERTQNGVDDFERPIYTNSLVDVENVLVTPTSSADAVNNFNLTGKTIEYELCIPKGDAHEWANTKVEFFGEVFDTIGFPTEYIENMLPLKWNKKIKVSRHE